MIFLKHYRIFIIGSALISFALLLGYIAYLSSRLDTVKIQRDQNASQLEFCVKQNEINQEVSYDYQKKLAATSSRIAHLKRMYADRCTRIITTSGSDGAPSNGTIERDGVRAEWLIDFAGRCESLKDQVNGLIDYMERIR